MRGNMSRSDPLGNFLRYRAYCQRPQLPKGEFGRASSNGYSPYG
jgi:hypothetical protein